MAEEDFKGLGNVQNMLERNGVLEDSYQPEEVAGHESALGVKEKKWPGWPGENVFRILVPVQRVGSIIGRKGEYIKKICEETKARIKILDGPPGTTERAVMVSAKEEPDLSIPPALDGLLRIHKCILDPEADSTNLPSGVVCTRLLVAGLQAGSLIGKQGDTIKSIQDDSHSTIRVLGGDHLPSFALPDDSVVEIKGEPTSVHKAVELIGLHLRKFLVDRSVIGIFETQMQVANTQLSQHMPPSLSWGLPPSEFPMNIPPFNGNGSNILFMDHPPHQYDNYRSPAGMPSLAKPLGLGLPNCGHDISVGAYTTFEPQQAVVAKVTQIMQIPLAYADRVIGVNGANISYIRRASGATVVVQESRDTPNEMIAEIIGSASQIQAAQQLIQNSIADAVSSAQNVAGPHGQAYYPYAAAPCPVYASSTTIAPANQTSMYGAGYGY